MRRNLLRNQLLDINW